MRILKSDSLRPSTPPLILASIAAATVLFTSPQAFDLRRSVGVDTDALFSVWRLAWVSHAMREAPTHVFDANIFYPEPRTLAYSDALLLPALISAPLQWLRTPPLLIYNLALLSAFFLSAAAMCLLVRSLTDNWSAGLLSGFAFAFSPHQIEHFGHLEIQLALWMPLSLWAIHRVAASGRMRDGLILGGLLTCQFYSGIYHGIFLLTYVAVVAPLVVFLRSPSKPVALLWIALGIVLAIAITLPYGIPYLHNRAELGERSLDEILLYSANYRDYFTAHPWNILYGGTLPSGHAERFLFPGSIAIGLAIIGISPKRNRTTLAYVIGLVFAVEMSRGLNSALYIWLHDHVVVYKGLRAPARFGILAQLSLAVLAGFGLDQLSRRITKTWLRRTFVTLLLLGTIIEYRASVALRSLGPPPKVYSWLRQQPCGPVLELPVARAQRLDISNDATYMYYSTAHWFPLVNGYSGFYPDSYIRLLSALLSFPDRRTINFRLRLAGDSTGAEAAARAQ